MRWMSIATHASAPEWDDYLTKPVERNSLLKAVDRWGSARRSSIPAALGSYGPAETCSIDEELLGSLVDAMGGQQTRRLLCGFRDSLVDMSRVFESPPDDGLRAKAHQLAGSAGALGFLRLSATASEVDVTLRQGQVDEAPIRRLKAELSALLTGLSEARIDQWLARFDPRSIGRQSPVCF